MRLALLPALLVLAACAPVAPGSSGSASSSASSTTASAIAASSVTAASVSSPAARAFEERDGDFSGTAIAIGYPVTESRPKSDCSMDCVGANTQAEIDACITGCATHRYVYLKLTGEIEPGLKAFLAGNDGNSFAGSDAVGLGCAENGILRSINFSATLGEREYALTEEAARRLLAATADAPVTLRLHKEPSAPGRGAPDCYTHFTTIDVL